VERSTILPYRWFFLLRAKIRLLKYLNITIIKLKLNIIKKIKVIRSDRDGEYKTLFGEIYS
jgi:hypothetical protein